MAILIDGDALIAWIKGSQQMTSKMKSIICYIKTIPTIEARPKGEWIEVTNGRGGHECSECHDYAPSFQNGAERLSHFCPSCGADMREREGE